MTLFEAARTPELFSNLDNILPPPPPGPHPYLPPITLDGEAHAKYRLPLMRMFTPARIHGMEGEIRLLTAVHDLEPFPAQVALERLAREGTSVAASAR